jgi:hypothetical protein
VIINNPNKLPYHNTKIPASQTKMDIINLLNSLGIKDIQMTTYHGMELLKFIWTLEVNGEKKEVHFGFSPPEILIPRKTWDRNLGRTIKVNVPDDAISWRILWHLLKNKLWGIKYGVESVEQVFMSHLMITKQNGEIKQLGEYVKELASNASVLSQLPSPKEERKVIIVAPPEKTDEDGNIS